MPRKIGRIGVDLDGTMYDFHGAYRYMMKAYHGVDMPPVKEFWTDWDAQEKYGEPADHAWMWSEGVQLGLFRYGHIIRGAYVNCMKLIEEGFELHVITHRPQAAVKDTIDWLAYVNIPWAGVHILSNGELKTSVAVDCLIDDKASNIDLFVNKGRMGVLMDQPWNQGYGRAWGNFHRVESWDEAAFVIGGIE